VIREELAIVMSAKDGISRVMSAAEKSVNRFGARVDKAFGRVQKNWVATAAKLYALKKAFDFADEAAKFQQMGQGFANVAASHGASADQIMASLRRVSASTISTASLMKSAGTAMVLGIPADKLTEMMEIARASARVTGQSTQQAFHDIARGIGRQSKLILDNLGIIVDAKAAYETYADSVGKTTAELTDLEKKQAFANAAMEAGRDIVRRVGVEGITAAEGISIFKAKTADLKVTFGKVLIATSAFITAGLMGLSSAFASTAATIAKFLSRIVGIGEKLPFVGEKFAGASAALKDFSEFEFGAAREAARLSEAAKRVGKSMFKKTEAIKGAIVPTATLAAADSKAAAASDKVETSIARVISRTAKLGASKTDLLTLQAQELVTLGASTDQLVRYTAALQAMSDKEEQIAAAKAAAEAAKRAADARESAAGKLAVLGAAPGAPTPEDEFSKAWIGYQAQLDALEEFNTRKIGLMIAAGASQDEIEAAYTAMTLDREKKKRDFQLTAASQTFGGMANLMQNLTVLTGKEGGAAFKAMKGFAIAQATIDTYKAATGAYAALSWIPGVGPALGVAAAAAAVVAGMARVKQIEAMHPGGSASGTTISAAGTANPSFSGGAPSAFPIPQRIQQQAPAPIKITLTVNTLDGRDVNWERIVEDNLGPALERIHGDGNRPLNITVAEV